MILAEPSTWIKLDRNILEWKWIDHSVTFHVFVYLLLRANIKAGDKGEVHVLRGQVLTSYQKIANDLGLTIQQVRTALSHLKATEEITYSGNPKYSLITVINYSKYQGDETNKPTRSQQNNNRPPTRNQQHNKNSKKEENEKKEYVPKSWELDIPKQAWGRFDGEDAWEAWKDEHTEEVESWLTN